MIDVENDVYSTVANELRTAFPGISVYGEYIESPANFPAVTIVEADNRVLTNMRTVKIENAASVMYEVNVYSNKASVRKEQAKAIATKADEVFESLGFTRTFREQIPNLRDATIYRIVCRYEAVVAPGYDGNYLIYQNY